MSAPTLRPYQIAALTEVEVRVQQGHRRVLVVAPTGSGKTVIAAEAARREVERGGRVLFLAPRRELITQASSKLESFSVEHGIILAGARRRHSYARVQVASLDTLRVRAKQLTIMEPALIIVDEAHLYATRIRQALLERWPDALRLGLTATPSVAGGRSLKALFTTMVEVATTARLTAEGYLVPGRYFSIAEPDLTGIKTVAGDYHLGQLGEVMTGLVGDIPTTWLERAPDRRTVVFAVNVAHSVALRNAFLAAGVSAEHVDGSTPLAERVAIFDRFRSGVTQVLTNCQLASYGFDLPELDCIVLARPTKSLTLYLQMIGRGLRPAPGKATCMVLDHSGAVHLHGLATATRVWTLDGISITSRADSRRSKDNIGTRQINCPKCMCVFEGGRLCPNCGHYFPPLARTIETVDGDLVEIAGEHEPDEADRIEFYCELRAVEAERGYKDGWAARTYRTRYRLYPAWQWRQYPLAAPTLATRRWIKSQDIRWAKGKGARSRGTPSRDDEDEPARS